MAIPERVLLGCGICGGALGALLGMRLFHHKTRHWYFTAINTAALLAWAALLAYRNGVFCKKLRCSLRCGGVFAAGHGNFCWCIQ